MLVKQRYPPKNTYIYNEENWLIYTQIAYRIKTLNSPPDKGDLGGS